MLNTDQRKQRIAAARILRGMTQTDLDVAGQREGLDKQELSRLERGEFGDRFSTVHRQALSRILRVPEAWFTEPSVDAIVGYVEADAFRTLAEIERLTQGLADVARELRRAQEGRDPEPDDTDRPQPDEGDADA